MTRTDGVPLADLRRHVASRPTWRCRACTAPWPCRPARVGLRIDYADDPVALSIYLGLLMRDAIADRIDTDPENVTPGEFHVRFIGWTRTPFPPPRVTTPQPRDSGHRHS